MNYSFTEYKVSDLIYLIDKDLVDLNPSYQRNFIWSTNDQRQLIDTILSGFPLPNFFIYKKPDGKYEMVDGQQRSKTIYRFVKGLIPSSKITGSLNFKDVNKDLILNYRIPIIQIFDLKAEESLNDFYVLINKKGIRLNVPEVNKSEFHDTNFMRLANEVLLYQNLIDLNIFTEATSKRMNDRAFIEELIAYLKHGIKDKKLAVEYIYEEEDLSDEDFENLKGRLFSLIDILYYFNKIKSLSKTRYKQKNDFYTLICFLNECSLERIDLLVHQYKILLLLDGVDSEGRQFIRPTNDKCNPLKEYAYNCVSQSNSKQARQSRLSFFNDMLKNRDENGNAILIDVQNYLADELDKDLDLVSINGYFLIEVDKLIF